MTQRPEPYQDLVTGATFDALDRLEAIAASRGTSLAGLALGWLLADERVTQVVIGPGRPEHLAPAAEALRHPVTEAERADIEAAVAGLSGRPQSQEAPSQEAPSQEAPSQEAPSQEAPSQEAPSQEAGQ
jgi:diketogulonate reductase-like aldo/keto reductase